MIPSVADAVKILSERGQVQHWRKYQPELIIDTVRERFGKEVPQDLQDFYRASVAQVGEFHALWQHYSVQGGWRGQWGPGTLKSLGAIPIFSDGSGNWFVFDMNTGGEIPVVYFADSMDSHDRLRYVAGTSLARFLRTEPRSTTDGRQVGSRQSIRT